MTKRQKPTLPDTPGVYFFKNSAGDVIYIGKAGSLKNRVASYFLPVKSGDWKKEALLDEYHTLDYLSTNTELEAALLEAELIQQKRPKYNVLMRDGQPFLYVLFTKEALPRMELVRNQTTKGHYYGPFLHKQKARMAYNFLLKHFRLKLCNKKIPNGCLDYHLGLCAGTCLTNFDQEAYVFRLRLAESVLANDHDVFIAAIKGKMETHNAAFEFEKSRQLYEYMTNFNTLFTTIQAAMNYQSPTEDETLSTLPALSGRDQSDLAHTLKELVGSPEGIHKIDCFDISHFQSKHMVGSCVRFVDGVARPRDFRHFIIKTLTIQNDYSALQEIIGRRYRDPNDFPDLILIDGGKGQLSAARAVLPPHIPTASLAKREERLYTTVHPEGVLLTSKTLWGKTLIALRDYTHHFAINFHRKRRSKKIVS